MNKLYYGDNLDILREHIAKPMGFFVTLVEATRPMREEATAAGFYNADTWGTEYPKLQILTIEGLMDGRERPRYPDLSLGRATFKKAAIEEMGGEQGKNLLNRRPIVQRHQRTD